jgi:PadR family transcriptional regulator, regulatory protein PadR
VNPPLQEPTFFILTALTGEPRHGYAIIQAVGELSAHRVRLSAGTLYPALDRLTQEGLIAVAREEVTDSRLRRYYELTDSGAERLAVDVARQTANARTAARSLAARTRRAAPAGRRAAAPRPGVQGATP